MGRDDDGHSTIRRDDPGQGEPHRDVGADDLADATALIEPGTAGADTCVLRVHVQPGAARAGVVGRHGDALKLKVQAPPVDGAANDALCALLAERLEVARRDVEVVSGASSRTKRVRVPLPSGECAARVAALLAASTQAAAVRAARRTHR